MTHASASPLSIEQVIEAIGILPDEQQQKILEEIQRAGGIDPQFADRIAQLLDAQVHLESEGGDIRTELEEADAALPELGQAAPAESDDATDALAQEVAEQQGAFDAWFAGVDGIVRTAERGAEAKKRSGEQETADRIRAMLHKQEANPEGTKLN